MFESFLAFVGIGTAVGGGCVVVGEGITVVTSSRVLPGGLHSKHQQSASNRKPTPRYDSPDADQCLNHGIDVGAHRVDIGVPSEQITSP